MDMDTVCKDPSVNFTQVFTDGSHGKLGPRFLYLCKTLGSLLIPRIQVTHIRLSFDLCFSTLDGGGKHFHPRVFLETVKQIYEHVFLRPLVKLCPALEQEVFATMLLDRTMTLELGTMLFKLYEELEIDGSTPDALLTVHNSVRHLRVEYLQEHWAS
ncbi:hypothetical protein DFJ58DRAFT_871798 [Suillus subalutaceus]|uniref:uncharacterized protein n=1 Tax=Suillus subalutaceus TaxID=48586 RepID=UPI001B8764B3|nr:uncharacterized protein DFJ58DRAFT_871798 [Suillus subalutaceus]KAG1861789.1 hypothetical protein DFJ58DRAFT_871798 [Suillus subalutaceus]